MPLLTFMRRLTERYSYLPLGKYLTFIVVLLARSVLAAEQPTQGPLSFERVIALVLTNNPDARIAQSRIRISESALAQANATVWPKLQLQSSYAWTDNPVGVFGYALNQRSYSRDLDFNNVPDADNLNVRGVVTLPLYQGGETKSARQAARSSKEATKADSQAVQNALGFEAARTFHTIAKTKQYVRATESAIQALEANLVIAQKREQNGTLLHSEVLDLEVRLTQAREDLIRTRNARKLAERALRGLLGMEQGELEIEDRAEPIPLPASEDFSGRPELASARYRAEAAEAGVRQSKSGYLPKLSAFGSLDYDHGWKFNGDGDSYMAGAIVQWNLWDGQLTKSKVAEARAHLEVAQEEERKVRLAVDLEVQQARLNLSEAEERLAVTAKAIQQAEESARLTRVRFEQGMTLASQLVDAETNLTTARVRRAEAEADRLIALAALRKALGLPQISSQF